MIHQTVKVYDEKTGVPAVDNVNRQKNRALNRVCRKSVRVVTPHGRRRKHVLTRKVYAQYAGLVAAVADEAIR